MAICAPGVSRSRWTPYPAAVESPSTAMRIGGRVRLTPAAAQVVSFDGGGASLATGMRRSASLTSPHISPMRAAAPVRTSPPSLPPVYSARRWARRRSVTIGRVVNNLFCMRYSDSLVELIGNTPLVRLHHVTDHLPIRHRADRPGQGRVLQSRAGR